MALKYNTTWAANFVQPKNTPLPLTLRPAWSANRKGHNATTTAQLKNRPRVIVP